MRQTEVSLTYFVVWIQPVRGYGLSYNVHMPSGAFPRYPRDLPGVGFSIRK